MAVLALLCKTGPDRIGSSATIGSQLEFSDRLAVLRSGAGPLHHIGSKYMAFPLVGFLCPMLQAKLLFWIFLVEFFERYV
jgi:hypothetical protein